MVVRERKITIDRYFATNKYIIDKEDKRLAKYLINMPAYKLYDVEKLALKDRNNLGPRDH